MREVTTSLFIYIYIFDDVFFVYGFGFYLIYTLVPFITSPLFLYEISVFILELCWQLQFRLQTHSADSRSNRIKKNIQIVLKDS